MGTLLRVHGIVKQFGSVKAIANLNLEVEEGEFFTLLGPSGCGKTTTLRVIAGLEQPTSGEIFLGNRCLVSTGRSIFVNPEKREMGMVFQSYALWPHMTVFQNIAYPLKIRRIGAAVIRQKIREVLEIVGLEGLEHRPPSTLSGGQQQRVALARALIFSPRVLLLDEPLSNLDAQLRDEMRRELKRVQRKLGITVLFVTHDQLEALSLSDRIAILNRGHLQQVGAPMEVYNHAATPFVRDFLGRIFALPGTIKGKEADMIFVELRGIQSDLIAVRACNAHLGSGGQEVMMAIRPEKIQIRRTFPQEKNNVVRAKIETLHFLGDRYEYGVSVGREMRVLTLPASQVFSAGQEIFLGLDDEHLTLWPA